MTDDGRASVDLGGTGMLPHPTGAFSVGRSGFEVRDAERAEIYSQNSDDRRELVTWIWYPTGVAPDSEPAAYLPAGWQPVDRLLGVDSTRARGHAIGDPPVSAELPSYPVLLFSPSGFPPLMWAAIAEELASHGYVIVGINHTYETPVTVFATGRTLPANPAAIAGVLGAQQGPHGAAFRARAAVCDYKAADLRSTAHWLASGGAGPSFHGRLDLGRLGAFGHSFGGNAALQWCRDDARCRAAANLDGALWSDVGTNGLHRPALQILADHHEFDLSPDDAVAAGMAPDRAWFMAEKSIAFDGWRTVHRTARPAYTAQVRGATHVSFMDVPFLPLRADAPISGLLAATSIDAELMWRIVTELLLAFFGETLDGPAGPTFEEIAARYPAVTVCVP
jgi:dienelactone hydrolase